MADQQEDRILEHEYDGIREYDNPMPRWWLWVFYATILIVPIYYIAPSPFGEGPGKVADYEAEMLKSGGSTPTAATVALSDEEYRARAGDAAVIAAGRRVFATNCAACHRADGGGGIGPNLTDGAWIHGAAPSVVHRTIAEGVLAKGMPPWGRLLKPEEVDQVAAYVMSLQGTKPANPKAPEGTVDTTAAVAPAPLAK
jgi:cytochrome c oxidase cbb3-type subunit III